MKDFIKTIWLLPIAIFSFVLFLSITLPDTKVKWEKVEQYNMLETFEGSENEAKMHQARLEKFKEVISRVNPNALRNASTVQNLRRYYLFTRFDHNPMTCKHVPTVTIYDQVVYKKEFIKYKKVPSDKWIRKYVVNAASTGMINN